MSPLFAGGVAILETKVSDRDGMWHVHLHILAEGQWLDVRELSRAWHEITGDSSICDIRAVGDSDRCAAYLTKYVSKPIDASLYACPEKLDEYILAIKGRKTMSTFGAWRGLKLKARPKDDTVWKNRCSLVELSRRCKAGDADARRLLALWRGETVPADTATPPPPAPSP
jgi:hypothetical protein